MGLSNAIDLLGALSSTKKQDPLRLASLDTSPGSPGEAKKGAITKLGLH